MALHQSRSLKESLKHVARPVWVHSSLIRSADQDGELVADDGAVFLSDRDPIRDVEDPVAPTDETGLSARPV